MLLWKPGGTADRTYLHPHMRTEHSLCTFTLSESSDARGWQTLRVRWSVSQSKCWLDRADDQQTTMRDTKAMGVAVEKSVSYLRVRSLGPKGICTRSVIKL